MCRVLVVSLFWFSASVLHAVETIPASEAGRAFAEARELAARDGGKLWGQSLAGPMMFVDPGTRALAANQPGPDGALHARDGVFVGTFPAEMNAANTSLEWLGTRWTQALWPLPEQAGARRVLLMHESFHRVQPALGLWPDAAPANAHLDTLEGRYLLRLEWLALARALQAPDTGSTRQAAIADALVFRGQRQVLFPAAQREENTMEEIEGLAEYTGVRLGFPNDPEQQTRYTLGELARTAQLDTFVRSFAYGTGPAYGLLLDRYDVDANHPRWRSEFKETPDFARLLMARVRIALPADLAAAVQARTTDAQSRSVRTEEQAREVRRLQLLAADRERLVDGPVLILPLQHMNVQFDPRNLRPLDQLGTVYPTLRVSDDWGVLEVTGGALLDPDWKRVTVVAPPTEQIGAKLTGSGWTLSLKEGWKFAPSARPGDFRLQAPST